MTIAVPDSQFEPAYLARLNDRQRAAVLHGDGQAGGPLLVVAGAGSDKTDVGPAVRMQESVLQPMLDNINRR